MTYPEFEARWKPAGGAERANYGIGLQNYATYSASTSPEHTTGSLA